MTTILVTGGTGHLGAELVPRLVGSGDVRVLSRRANPPLPDGARAVRGDITTGDGIEAALQGVDVLVHLASDTTTRATMSAKRGRMTEVQPTRRMLEIAKRVSSPHVVYTSIVGVDSIAYPYYKTKVAVEGAIRASGLPHTIFRSTQWHTLAWDFAERFAKMPVVMVPKGMSMQLLDPGEVAERVASLVATLPGGFAPEMGGPKVWAIEDIVRSYLAATGKRKRVVTFPLPGKTMRAFKRGDNLAPDHAVGTVTWEEWLSRRLT